MMTAQTLVGGIRPLVLTKKNGSNMATRTSKRLRLATCAATTAVRDVAKNTKSTSSLDEYDPSYDGPAKVARPTTGRVVLESEDELKSTWEQRAWVGGTILLLASTFAVGADQAHGDFGQSVQCVAAVYFGWCLADLGSGLYHFGVDK